MIANFTSSYWSIRQDRTTWMLCYYSTEDGRDHFVVTIDIAKKIEKRLKELFKNVRVTVSPKSGTRNEHVDVSVTFDSHEDNDYFIMLSCNGLDI